MKPPICKKVKHEITQHGQTRVDNYHWLRDENWKGIIDGDKDFANPEIKQYIEACNKHKDNYMEDYKDVEKKLYDEILSRIKEDKVSFPMKHNSYFYYYKEEEGLNYRILCRKKANSDGSMSGQEEIYFDINKEADGRPLYSFRTSDVNDADSYFAYNYNLTGSLEGTLRVRDLNTGKDLEWEIENTTGSFTWISDTELYYCERDEFSRGKKVYKLNVEEGVESKKLIFTKPDEYQSMFMGLSKTTDKSYLTLDLESGSTRVVYVSKTGSDIFDKFIVGENDIVYDLEHHKDSFYILTNQDAPDFQVMKTKDSKDHWDRSKWEPFILEEKGRCLDSHSIYNEYIVIERKNNETGLTEITVSGIEASSQKVVKVEQEVYGFMLIGSHDPQDTKLRVALMTPTSPMQTLELDVLSLNLKHLHTEEVPNFDSSNYVSKREYAKARDGQMIPLTIIHKKGVELNSNNPTFVYAYGSYGYGMPPYFSASRFSLIDRGFVYCVAHIRGGDEKGNSWYLDGKMRNKMNTFNDFIDSCEHLIDRKYTSKKEIAINGGSAGGLLMGAVTNMRPDLFKAVVAAVAFVDVINTISDATLPLTPPEWEEWGDPIKNKGDFEYMIQYSPYDNVSQQEYPAMLYNSGISDEQVTYWEPTKMVAKLAELKTDDNPLLLNMKMHAGHAGASKKYESIKETAFDFSFVLKSFNMR